MSDFPEKLLLAAPRGYCAGVDRAVQTVERALELYGPPVYVRKEIVHNKHVVEQLRERGAIFVEQETEVPEGELVVFSAHGVGHEGHEEVEGTTGEAPAHIVLVQTAGDVDELEVADPNHVAYITQTTLSVD